VTPSLIKLHWLIAADRVKLVYGYLLDLSSLKRLAADSRRGITSSADTEIILIPQSWMVSLQFVIIFASRATSIEQSAGNREHNIFAAQI